MDLPARRLVFLVLGVPGRGVLRPGGLHQDPPPVHHPGGRGGRLSAFPRRPLTWGAPETILPLRHEQREDTDRRRREDHRPGSSAQAGAVRLYRGRDGQRGPGRH
ncbi:MAG: hypothetical protein MZV64_09495 [Ignavibacteriales bacterium]|nr:hypothetical protein [Ignavibacteriales bacterium]